MFVLAPLSTIYIYTIYQHAKSTGASDLSLGSKKLFIASAIFAAVALCIIIVALIAGHHINPDVLKQLMNPIAIIRIDTGGSTTNSPARLHTLKSRELA